MEESKKEVEEIDTQKEYRKTVSCEKCGSGYVYVKVNGDIQCRRCRHLTLAIEEDN